MEDIIDLSISDDDFFEERKEEKIIIHSNFKLKDANKEVIKGDEIQHNKIPSRVQKRIIRTISQNKL